MENGVVAVGLVMLVHIHLCLLNKLIYLACRKHHLRVSKIVREAGEDALQEKLDRLNKKIK